MGHFRPIRVYVQSEGVTEGGGTLPCQDLTCSGVNRQERTCMHGAAPWATLPHHCTALQLRPLRSETASAATSCEACLPTCCHLACTHVCSGLEHCTIIGLAESTSFRFKHTDRCHNPSPAWLATRHHCPAARLQTGASCSRQRQRSAAANRRCAGHMGAR